MDGDRTGIKVNTTSDERNHKLKPLFDKIRIEESHQYCQSSGLDKESIWPMGGLSGSDLASFLQTNSALSTYCRELFIDIARDFTDGNDLFVLSDANARLINLYSDPEILRAVTNEIGLSSGVLLSEASCGTNAIALALRYLEPMITRGQEHYCRMLQNWGAVALPVLGTDGQAVACIAIFNCTDSSLSEKLLLARFIVKALERFYLSPPMATPVSSPPRIPERRKQKPLSPCVGLTSRQHQVLQLFAQGKSYKQIAREIGISSFKTVEEHLDAVREKLQVAHRRECIQKAMSLGLI